MLTGVGAAGPTLVSEYPLGEKVTVSATVTGLPPNATDAIGGGPALVRDGVAIPEAGEGFTGAQTDSRTSRSAVGQTADGTTLFVTVEGPSQGRPGMSAADQAALMKSLGARTAVAMDGGGSAQLAVRDDLVIPWSGARSLSDVVVMSYRGVTIEPLPFRISPNADRVNDAPTTVIRSPVGGTTAVKVIRRSGSPSKQIWRGRLGASSAKVNVDPRRLRLPDGVYDVRVRQLPDDGSGVTEQSRRVIVDRTLGSLNATQSVIRIRTRRQPRLTVSFRLSRAARATVRIRTTDGVPIATIASGRPLRAGRQAVNWNRRVHGKVLTGTVNVTVEARGPLGTSGLVREVTLTKPPKPAEAAEAAQGAHPLGRAARGPARQSSSRASISAWTAWTSPTIRSISTSSPDSPPRWRTTRYPRSCANAFWRRFSPSSWALSRASSAPFCAASAARFAASLALSTSPIGAPLFVVEGEGRGLYLDSSRQ